MMKINPLFNQKKIPNKVEASASPISNQEMSRVYIITSDNKKIPVEVDIDNRVCLPIQKGN